MRLLAWLGLLSIIAVSVGSLQVILMEARRKMQSRRKRDALRRWLRTDVVSSPQPSSEITPVEEQPAHFSEDPNDRFHTAGGST